MAKKKILYQPWIFESLIFSIINWVFEIIAKFIYSLSMSKYIFLWRFERIIPYRARRNHTFIMAWSGSGKTELIKLIIYSLINSKRKISIVLFDVHWDLGNQVAQWKEFWVYKNRLVIIDMFLKEGYMPSFNPFYLKERTEKNIGRMTQALIGTFESLLGNSFTARMESVLRYCVPVLLRRENSSMKDLKRFMDIWEYQNNQDLIKLGLNSPFPEHREFFSNDFLDSSLDPTKRGLRDRISAYLSSPIFAKFTTGKNSIDLEKLINQGKVIVLNISKWNLWDEISKAMWGLIFWYLQYLAFKRNDMPISHRRDVQVFIDEYQNLTVKDPKKFEDMLSEARKFGFSLTLANQYPKQIWADLREAIEENAQVKIRWYSQKDDDLKKLRTWEFYVEIIWREKFKMTAPKFLLWSKNKMRKRKWDRVIKYQIDRYYRSIEKEIPAMGNIKDDVLLSLTKIIDS